MVARSPKPSSLVSAAYKAIAAALLEAAKHQHLNTFEFQSKLIARRDRRQRTILIQTSNYLHNYPPLSPKLLSPTSSLPLLEIRHHACSSIQLFCFFFCFKFANFVAHRHAFNSASQKKELHKPKEDPAQAYRIRYAQYLAATFGFSMQAALAEADSQLAPRRSSSSSMSEAESLRSI
ncbi:hypothetical protein GMOD_00004449 [Pyrenophora seminiperda CCB06]|uniref:Uncharacterized protein n=1 Tax=Pyrenophora seminiperda CCB06 TaxID=1302712 RepID=A0A3M7M1A3_9PLEO|nr:hypothetical protein GMOD_00004449 [Pyrenophora seminiperda CCB06]